MEFVKTFKWILALSSFLSCGLVYSEESDSLGVIGDNLDLYAVLDAFKNAETVEEFEKAINNPDNKINNLDLNEDGEVDFIKVIDNAEDDAHAITLRIDTEENESQDIAVIELEKAGDETANIQIVGDEEIYGEDYIVEPSEEVTKGKMPPVLVVINVWHWPCVKFIYGPRYKPYVSPWGWRRHPAWWKPWKPYHWRAYHAFHAHHRHHYRAVKVHRMNRAHKIYHNHRRTWKHIHNHKNHHHNKGHHQGGGHHHKGGNKVQKHQGPPQKRGGGRK